MREALQLLVNRDVAENPDIPGRMLHVLGPELDVEVAAGVADHATGGPLVPGMRFRIASVTKTFVAAATLRLVEEGRLDLRAPIAGLVDPQTERVLREGGYRPDTIELHHLLTHTSGIYDFAADAYDAAVTEGFVAACMADPSHRWSRMEQLRFAIEHGAPYGEPGEVYAYSDTGANLVGEILERATGQTMGGAIRELVGFERLGLAHTYHESVEAEPPGLPPIAHQYEDDFDVWNYDASVDLWGGGGLVSTCADLARFFRALLAGDVFRGRGTLDTMCALPLRPPADGSEDPEALATGMFIVRHEIAGREWWGHGGYWGTAVVTCPDLDVTVVSQDGQAFTADGYSKYAIVADVVRALGR